jgi:hypothetical protein
MGDIAAQNMRVDTAPRRFCAFQHLEWSEIRACLLQMEGHG